MKMNLWLCLPAYAVRRRVSFMFPSRLLVALAVVSSLSGARLQAQTAHFSWATLGSGFSTPAGVAVDGSGNVYVADFGDSAVKEIVAADGSVKTLGSGFSTPAGVAVDGNRNVYVADFGDGTPASGAVKEIVAAGGYTTVNTLTSGFSPFSVAVDGSGNVYVADTGNSAVKEIVAAGGYTTVTTLASGFNLPTGVAVDGSGNVYVADTGNNAVKEIVAAGGYTTVTTLSSGFYDPFGVAVDGSGNVYVADAYNFAVKEIVAAGGYATVNTLASGFNLPTGVAVDGSGNVYVADYSNNAVKEIVAVSFGSAAVGTAAPPGRTLTFTFDTAGSPGKLPTVLTHGAAGLDFADAGTGSCTTNGTSHSYNAGDTCTVDVTFKPEFAGERNGAVVLYGSSGALIATANIYGTGVGPQVVFAPATQTTMGSGFFGPYCVAVDGSGNVYVADTFNNAVKEIVAAGGYTTVNTLGSGFNTPEGVAVDGSGNVYVADFGNNSVKEIVAAGGYTTVNTLGSGFSAPFGVAVDGSGNVYVSDFGNSAVKEIVAAGGYTTVATLGSGFYAPSGVAVDGSGNVYVADTNHNAVKEIVAAGGYTTVTTLGSGFSYPWGVTVDGSGNVYVADTYNNAVKEIGAAGGYTAVTTLGSGFSYPRGVAVDGSGNVYVADSGNNAVKKLDRADAPSLSFAATNADATSSDSPQTVTVSNIGNATLSFPIPGLGNNPSIAANFTLDSSDGTDCPLTGSTSSAPGTLASGASCTLPISFTPGTTGSITGSLVLTDDALNVTTPSYATQTISLSGTGDAIVPTLTFATIATHTYGDAAFNVSATSASAGAVTYSVTGPATISGSTVTITGIGTVYLSASQVASGNYAAATATTSFTVNLETPTLSFAAIATHTYGDVAFNVSATSASAGAVTYSVTGPATINGSTVTITGIGTVNLSASQAASGNYAAATATTSFTVSPETTTLTFAAIATHTYGDAAFSVSATSASSGAVTYSVTSGPATINGNTVTITGAGTVVLSASQVASGNYAAPVAATTSFAVGKEATTDAVVTSSATIEPGQSVTLTATIKPATSGAPSGTVTFYDNGNPIGSAVTLVSGAAQIQTTALTPGQSNVIFVSYSGDGNFLPGAAAMSSASTITVAQLDFTLGNMGGASQSVAPGDAAMYSFTLAPTFGVYPGIVNFTATGLPLGATAIFSPANIAADGGAQTVTLTVQTATGVLQAIAPRSRRNGLFAFAFFFLPLAGTRKMRRAAQRLGRRTCLALFLLLSLGAVAGLTGCGGGNSSFGHAQNYNISVAVTSGAVQHTSNVTLQVQ